MKIEKEKKYMKRYYYKRKNLLNHLINRVEELENVSLNKLIRILKKLESKHLKSIF